MVPEKRTNKTAHSLAANDTAFSRKQGGFFVAGLDAAIALYMRCAGYTTQEVANELFRHTPARPNGQIRDERIEYGRRVVWYAFGAAGDIDIANISPTQEQILNFVRDIESYII